MLSKEQIELACYFAQAFPELQEFAASRNLKVNGGINLSVVGLTAGVFISAQFEDKEHQVIAKFGAFPESKERIDKMLTDLCARADSFRRPAVTEGEIMSNGAATHGEPILIVRAQLEPGSTFKMGDKVKVTVERAED